MSKVQVAFGTAFAGFAGLWVVGARVRWERKRDISRPELFQEEMNDEDDVEEFVVEGAAPIRLVHGIPPLLTPSRVLVSCTCCALIAVGLWFGVRNYLIIHSWERGETLMGNRDFVGAETIFRKTLQLDPSSPRSHLLFATALLRQGETARAIPELRLAVQDEHSNAEAYLTLGDALQMVGKPDESVAEYEQAIAIAPKSADNYVRLGSALVKLRRNADAIKQFQYAIVLDPKNVKAFANLGYARLIQGDIDGGLLKLKRCVELSPDDVAARNELGNAYLHTGRFREAASVYRASLAVDPEFAVAYFNLGIALMDCGDSVGAVEAYQSYLRKCATNPAARIVVPEAVSNIKMLKARLKTQRSSARVTRQGQ